MTATHETTTDDSGDKSNESSQPKTPEAKPDNPNESIYDKSLKLKDEMKEQLDRREKLIDREEKLQAHQMLGGRSDAGQPQVKEAEQSPEDYAKEVLEGKHNEKKEE